MIVFHEETGCVKSLDLGSGHRLEHIYHASIGYPMVN